MSDILKPTGQLEALRAEVMANRKKYIEKVATGLINRRKKEGGCKVTAKGKNPAALWMKDGKHNNHYAGKELKIILNYTNHFTNAAVRGRLNETVENPMILDILFNTQMMQNTDLKVEIERQINAIPEENDDQDDDSDDVDEWGQPRF